MKEPTNLYSCASMDPGLIHETLMLFSWWEGAMREREEKALFALLVFCFSCSVPLRCGFRESVEVSGVLARNRSTPRGFSVGY